jgi:uncharacterized SAM-binding protein YcdF (DUF218 family)
MPKTWLNRRVIERLGRSDSLWDALNRPGRKKNRPSGAEYSEREEGAWEGGSVRPDSKPIEPAGAKWRKPNFLKWVFFLVVILYVLISYYHAPILKRLGHFLVVEHSPQRADLIVCLAGRNVERGLAAADAYKQGLSPKIFVSREKIPDGYDLFQQKGVAYPESRDLLVMALENLGVPESALVISDTPVKSTHEEAVVVKALMTEKNYRSVILITSPPHSRRAWLTFKRVMGNKEMQMFVLPTPYSKYNPEDWWTKREYVQEVILEYERLAYDSLRNLW